jgi:hypothetical protein
VERPEGVDLVLVDEILLGRAIARGPFVVHQRAERWRGFVRRIAPRASAARRVR